MSKKEDEKEKNEFNYFERHAKYSILFLAIDFCRTSATDTTNSQFLASHHAGLPPDGIGFDNHSRHCTLDSAQAHTLHDGKSVRHRLALNFFDSIRNQLENDDVPSYSVQLHQTFLC